MITMSDLFHVSLRQVIRQRNYGVVISIALGITAFIVLAVLGREIRYKIGQDMLLMGGVNVIHVYMEDTQYPGQPLREFYPETIQAIAALPGVSIISRNVRDGQLFGLRGVGERSLNVLFSGVDEKYTDVFSLDLVAGRIFTSEDIDRRRRVCMLGIDAARNLYGDPEQAVGKLVFLQKEVFEVVGVITGVMLGSEKQNGFLPCTTMIDRKWAGDKISRIYVRATGWEDVSRLVKQIPALVREKQSAPYVVLRIQDEQLKRIQFTFIWVEALLWLSIVASLMLGGFGIWSGTFAAVRARTREVGLKKAMGGSDIDILVQFLAEALCKAMVGGVLGIVVGALLVAAGSWTLATGFSYSLLWLSSLGSIIFSAAIGVAGGLYPAVQASRMDVVAALRFE
ncbi:ABC efflux transporter permease [Candidatus Desulfovibrio trichonymphae]|uniref:ABC efflux transporter permease n=2 Tax=Candidatus Desulfovibrio trichonymphae TaxID=1725232 RepID=A0A1J1E3C6_9BACT|nr:ABC efflux transporter permease [Candidatus Desulfovibrio trichonymphae]